ncbi:MAG: VOC family protein [Pseudomonadota bacterium]
MFRRIDHIALHVNDLEKSVKFYRDNFDFEDYASSITPHGMKIVYLKLGDTVLEFSDFSEGEMQGFHFCLETDNFDQAVARLINNGVVMKEKPHNTAARIPAEQGWRRAVFVGVDGEKIEIRGK